MASEIAMNALNGLLPGSTVLDPMCGSGVVVRRALDQGHIGIGVDIDPLAVLMARVWTTRLSSSIQPDIGSRLTRQAKALLGEANKLPWIDRDKDTTEYISYWFAPTQTKQIRALLTASANLRGRRKDIVNLALSRVIVTKSRGASLAADVSHSRPHRVRTDNNFDVFEGFERSLRHLIRILRRAPLKSDGRVRLGDARTLRGIRRDSIDAVITSPPYLNAIDYLRGHKLALVWLGYPTPEILDIRSRGIGAPTQRKRRETGLLKGIVQEACGGELPSGIEKAVKRYVFDMIACLRQTYRVLRPEGYAVYVVSNSILKGVEVDTATIIKESASEVGMHLTKSYVREIPRKHRYLPPPQESSDPKLATRMRTETVLHFQKVAA